MITDDAYMDQFGNLWLQFQLAGRALDGWTKSQDALDRYAKQELEDAQALLGPDFDTNHTNEFLAYVKAQVPRKVSDVQMRLRQYRYILLVAIFENFIESIHREILQKYPHLLKANRLIELGKLVSSGRDAVIAGEVEREVQSVDRFSVEKKVSYFCKRLGINWQHDAKTVSKLDRAIALRNTILHENLEHPIVFADEVDASWACMGVANTTVYGAGVLYPEVCSLPEGISREEAQKRFVYPCRVSALQLKRVGL